MSNQQHHCRVLLVDDEESIRKVFSRELESLGHEVFTSANAADARQQIDKLEPEVMVLDIRLPGISGDRFLAEIQTSHPHIAVIILTGHADVELAVECMKLGASDLLTKPCSIDHLDLCIQRAARHVKLQEESRTILRHAEPKRSIPDIAGSGSAVTRLKSMIKKIAKSDESILIVGESGTGKELIATAIQQQSLRNDRPFITVNCAAVMETLLESELFGHEKGSFSGATERRIGFFEMADGGTLFLDEIGDMSLSMQPKLLRVLQTGEFRRVGGNRVLYTDTRVIAATNKNLYEEVQEGRFREDLLHRINTITLESVSLRDRLEDLEELVQLFTSEATRDSAHITFSKEAMDCLHQYSWPGNIRELRNVIRRAVLLADSEVIQPEDLPSRVTQHQVAGLEQSGQPLKMNEMTLSEIEKHLIYSKLEECNGNKTKTAKELGISVKTLYNKLEAWQSLED